VGGGGGGGWRGEGVGGGGRAADCLQECEVFLFAIFLLRMECFPLGKRRRKNLPENCERIGREWLLYNCQLLKHEHQELFHQILSSSARLGYIYLLT
jgi:hypothetical protein